MPIYNYQCCECGCRDERVAGLDDATAICAACGALMLRLDKDIFEPYFSSTGLKPVPPGGRHGAEKG